MVPFTRLRKTGKVAGFEGKNPSFCFEHTKFETPCKTLKKVIIDV